VQFEVALVDEPGEVRIRSVPSGAITIFEVTAAPSDIGKIIGKNGRTARAIRELLLAIGPVSKTRYGLDIVAAR